ncbi:MAG: hypothetical protein JMJ93_06875 [Synergistaceae bacterium]|nr:hypothetical protein [Synergistaceae bacterium]
MSPVHRYRCSSCGAVFASESHASKCPHCRGRVLVHLEGERRRFRSCSGDCRGCSGCGGH